jgi:signal transduction histidine kinase
VRLDTALWRAVAVYRFAALLYAAGSMAVFSSTYARPALGWAVLAGMAVWTAGAAGAYARRPPGWPLLGLDLTLTVAALLSSVLVLEPDRITGGDPTLTVSWAAAPVLAWAVHAGWRGGAAAAIVVGTGAVLERGGLSQATVNSLVLLLLLGVVVGYVVALARRASSAYAEAVALRSAAAERERLSRSVHDGVLQALALVARRSSDPQLASLAAEQEVALRRLVSGRAAAVPTGEADLRVLLPAGADVQLAAPAGPVLLPSAAAGELAAAVGAAVDNARRHGGGGAWLLVEDEPEGVTVTVRDDGPGIPDGRLEEAERAGRLGVAQSIRGRLRELGGTVTVHSEPGRGTEVELRVPRA